MQEEVDETTDLLRPVTRVFTQFRSFPSSFVVLVHSGQGFRQHFWALVTFGKPLPYALFQISLLRILAKSVG